MIVVDLNLLIYAINRDAPRHDDARRWLEATLSGDEPVGLAWMVLLGFLRITTHPRVLPRPLAAAEAVEVVEGWLTRPCARTLSPSERHWPILRELLAPLGCAGNLTSDAHLAALAIEHGATLCSTDNDFARFPRLRFVDPLQRQ